MLWKLSTIEYRKIKKFAELLNLSPSFQYSSVKREKKVGCYVCVVYYIKPYCSSKQLILEKLNFSTMTGSSSRLSSFGGEKCHHFYKKILSTFFACTMKFIVIKKYHKYSKAPLCSLLLHKNHNLFTTKYHGKPRFGNAFTELMKKVLILLYCYQFKTQLCLKNR
jgi:hypothetical protein